MFKHMIVGLVGSLLILVSAMGFADDKKPTFCPAEIKCANNSCTPNTFGDPWEDLATDPPIPDGTYTFKNVSILNGVMGQCELDGPFGFHKISIFSSGFSVDLKNGGTYCMDPGDNPSGCPLEYGP